ncbi:GFA family protein [Pelagibacterium lentulum]|uniref:Aldehyde-activating protein n=1 Tax=Pelagibacterium lentulum TaxID=2029865 RepID=A0A916VWK2_9HYPH|nr:GFA family protein [Pelagibacterium lentulum]GGA46979.1 aldehyde-activating protein [Pelagibacterium lentulum]
MPIKGSCHCGATQFEIDFTPESATRCNCTFCTKRGALWIYGEPDKFRLLTPMDANTRYSPTWEENKHYFCATCGCTTFSDNPDYSLFMTDPENAEANFDPSKRRISVNLWLLDDFDIQSVPIEHIDGRNGW